jgi:hypothetical protein
MTARWPVFLVGLLLSAASASAGTPPVQLLYADGFDAVCAQQTKYSIQPAWIAEVNQRLPEFQREWQKRGEPLLRATEQVVGKKFHERAFQVSLSVCSFPSMAEPLLINARFSLKSFIADALPVDVTVSIIFHELLHRYLSGRMPQRSAVLARSAGEDDTVQSHLHLFAVQKAVYLRLGLRDTLERVIVKDRQLPNKSYGRTWDMLDDGGTYSALIGELKSR